LTAPQAELAVNRWIIGEVVETLEKLNKAFAEFRFDGMADAIYHFTWGTFCDWYLELIKPPFVDGEKQEMDEESKLVAGWVLDQILVMLHPFMPFITEELWHAMGERKYDLIHAKWPEPKAEVVAVAKAEIEFVVAVVEGVRSQKLETGFRPSDMIPVSVTEADANQIDCLNRNEAALRRLARVRPAIIEIDGSQDTTSWSVTTVDQYQLVDQVSQTGFVTAQFVIQDVVMVAFTDGFIDVAAEKARITKAIEAATKERDALGNRLSNPAFVEKAKPEAVEKARADHAEKAAEVERLQAALARLG
jgi:valyl-tRNA synthetase